MNDRKIASTDQSTYRTLGIVLGVVSALGVVVSIINVVSN